MLRRKLARGFTRSELLTVIVVVAIIFVVVAGVLLPAMGGSRGHPQMKDSSQIRGIMQSMVIWAGNNKGRYPLPSDIDKDNTTVAEIGPAKDATGNILSLLVYNGLVATDMLISPVEVNEQIRQCSAYQFTTPESALVPDRALWDPALSADFSGTKIAHNSYAHIPPSGPRLDKWTDTFDANAAILGNRGPQIASVTRNADHTVKAIVSNPKSNTFLIHGGPKTWEGNIGFGDCHVDFETNLSPDNTSGLTYKDAAGIKWPDLFHYDEPDDPTGTNTFLGIFTKAGPKPADFNAIWD